MKIIDKVRVPSQTVVLFTNVTTAQYLVTQTGNKINALQKQIGDARRDGAATDKLVRAKEDLKSAKSDQEFSATEKLTRLRSKLKKVGNYVHPTVTVSNNEVSLIFMFK